MKLIQSVILGIVQGLTEFLPISSTAHLRIVPSLLNWEDPGTAFSAIIQLGTMFSVVIFFWKDLLTIYSSFLKELFYDRKLISYDSKLGFWILVGTIPICIFGILFKVPLEEGAVRDLNLVAFVLILFSIFLFFSELYAKQNRNILDLSFTDVLLIGLAQAFALMPGVSRSGATIFAGLLIGLKRHEAARFSFLLSVPAVLASGLLELYTLISSIQTGEEEIILLQLFFGLIFAFISGYIAIDFLLKYLKTHKTYIFIIYRIVLAALVIYLNFRGIIH